MLIRSAGQLHYAGMSGVATGIDMGVALQLCRAAGYDEQALSVLLAYGEAGMVKGLRARRAE